MFVINPTSNVDQSVVAPQPAIKAERGCIKPKSAKICPFRRHVFCQLAFFSFPSCYPRERRERLSEDPQFRQHSRYSNQPNTGARTGSFLSFLVSLPVLLDFPERFNREVLEMRATIDQ